MDLLNKKYSLYWVILFWFSNCYNMNQATAQVYIYFFCIDEEGCVQQKIIQNLIVLEFFVSQNWNIVAA